MDSLFVIYAFCTDFVINTANLLGLSYNDVNAILFFVLFPLTTVLLVGLVVYQHGLLRRIRARSSRTNEVDCP